MGKTLERDIFNMPIKRKGAINSKQKGNNNELACAKAIAHWVGKLFYRTPMSGGLRRSGNHDTDGDLSCEDTTFHFPFTIETKHLKTLEDTEILAIWKQTLASAIRGKKLPIAFLRKNRQPMFRPKEGEDAVPDYLVVLAVDYGGALATMRVKNYKLIHSNKRNSTLAAFNLSDILRSCPYAEFISAIDRCDYLNKFLLNEVANA